MSAAPLPTPNYITYTANVRPLIGTDKILVSDVDSTVIPTAEADQLIASAEGIVLADLSPYFVTVPALITTAGGVWTTLPPQTYSFVYNMFVYQASLQLIRAFIERNTDARRELDEFVDYYGLQYSKYLNRLMDRLPNGAYRYQLIGLQTLNSGIPRTPANYVRTGSIGLNGDYPNRQMTNPQSNFSGVFPWLYGGEF
jgi:hypothetical protein